MVARHDAHPDSLEEAAAPTRAPKGKRRGPRARRRGEGSARWVEHRKRFEVRAAGPHGRRISRYLPDPAKYEGWWPSQAGWDEADAELDELLHEIRVGLHDPDEEPVVDGLDATLHDYTFRAPNGSDEPPGAWEAWLRVNTVTAAAPERKLRPRTADGYREVYDRRIAPVLGTKRLADLVPADADRLRVKLTSKNPYPGRKDPLSEASARRAVAVLRSIVKVGERNGLLEHGMHKRFDMPGGAVPHEKKVPTATVDQIAALLRLCCDPDLMAENPTAAALAVVAATGARRSEALALTWADVNLADDKRTVRVHRSLTERSNGELVFAGPKSRYSKRTVRIPAALAQALRDLRKRRPGTRYLAESLRKPGQPTRPTQADRAGRRLLREVGVEQGGWHAVRHGLNEAMLARGENPMVMARMLGHTPEVNVGIYGGGHEAGVLAAGDAVADVLALPVPEAEEAV